MPNDINVFTDGSWLNPSNQYLSLGGAGVWWPGRLIDRSSSAAVHCPHHRPISHAESEISYFRQEHDGVSLFAKIGGYSGSSTRTELAAGIIAVCAHGPVHIGSDSEVFVNGANDLIKRVNEVKKACKNWKLTSDDDL